MTYSTLPIMSEAGIDSPSIRYVWDDTRVDEDFQFDADHVVERLTGVTLRARLAMGVALYDWTLTRFRLVSADPLPSQIAEAAWCATIDERYLKYVELDRRNWLGPVRGPLWCAVTWLLPMLAFGDDRPEEVESGLSFLTRLAVHVLPASALFEKWLDLTLARLNMLYVAGPEDPYVDLFGEAKDERRGPLIAREAFDPRFDYRVEDAQRLVRQFLATVDHRQNPFLRSPEELQASGFTGLPYTLERG